jgi:putative Holliday junction resolvase
MWQDTLKKMNNQTNMIDNENVYDENHIKQGSVIAFDFGERRIGIAHGEHLLGQAKPLTTIDNESNTVRFNLITDIVNEWNPRLFIVGLPLNLAGEETEISKLCVKFARRLNGRFNIPVIFIDERFTSAEASELLKEQGVHGMAQKSVIDQVAASTILQSYFDGL